MDPQLTKVLERVNLVVFQTRIVTPIRDTGEGRKDGSRIEKVLQACFDPVALRPLMRKKQEASRMCRYFGTKVETLNAWAVPVERTQDLLGQLGAIADEWARLADELAKSIHACVTNWAELNPGEGAAIHALAPTAVDVRASTRFIYTSFRLRSEDVDDSGCLENDLGGLAEQTLHELAVALRDAKLDKSSSGQYTQGVKDVFARLAVKAESLAFLDERVAEVASVLTNTIAMLPVSGKIGSAHAVLVKTVVDQMLDPRKLMRAGFAKIEEHPSVDAVSLPVLGNSATEEHSAEVGPIGQPERPVSTVLAMPSKAFSW